MRIIAHHDQDGRADGMAKYRSKTEHRALRTRPLNGPLGEPETLACLSCLLVQASSADDARQRTTKILLNQVFGR
jgi:hypothetical protein